MSQQFSVRSSSAIHKNHAVYIYIPDEHVYYGTHKKINAFHTGTFTAYCPVEDSFNVYVCQDHGQYPWGHCPVRGTMAYVCKYLGILFGCNARNTCLPLHLTIGLLENGILSLDEIIGQHRKFFRSFLSTTHMRDGSPTITSFFGKLNLWKKAYVHVISAIDADKFVLRDKFYGSLTVYTIYIVHVGVRFFLAKKFDLT